MKKFLFLLVFLTLFLNGCFHETVSVSTHVGEVSVTAKKHAKTYQWELISVPDGTKPLLMEADTKTVNFYAEMPGEYKLELKYGKKLMYYIITVYDNPELVITSPQIVNDYMDVYSDRINISGYYEGELKAIALFNNNFGYYHICNNDNKNKTFNCPNVLVHDGDNKFTILSEDIIKTEVSYDFTAIKYFEYVFQSLPTLSSESAMIGEKEIITARVSIIDNGAQSVSVKLVKVEADGTETFVADMYDKGDVSNGDDIAADGVYSTIFEVYSDKAEKVQYRVVVINGGKEFKSLPVIFEFFAPLDFEAMDRCVNIVNKTLTEYPNGLKTNQQIQEFVLKLKKTNEFEKIEILSDSIIIYPKNIPIPIMVFIDDDKDIKKSSTATLDYERTEKNAELFSSEINSNLTTFKNLNYLPAANMNYVESYALSTMSTNVHQPDNQTAIGAKTAIFLNASSDFTSDTIKAYNLHVASTTPEFEDIVSLSPGQITVKTFAELSGYGFIYINSHGGIARLPGDTARRVYIGTEEVYTAAKMQQYYINYGTSSVGISVHNNVSYFSVSSHVLKKNNFNNALIFLSICKGFNAEKELPNVLVNSNAAAVTGYENNIGSRTAKIHGEKMSEGMIGGNNITKSVRDANQYLNTQGNVYELLLHAAVGKENLVYMQTGIMNGGFEKTNLYWISAGDVRFINRLGPLATQEGNLMAIISTGLGSIADSNSYITQKFIIPQSSDKLVFTYNVVSEEPMEWVGSKYDDKFLATLTVEGQNVEIASETINTSAWFPISGIDFYGGDDTTFHTGWKTVEYDISQFEGKTAVITFHVWDKGDSIYDTAALIDDIKITLR